VDGFHPCRLGAYLLLRQLQANFAVQRTSEEMRAGRRCFACGLIRRLTRRGVRRRTVRVDKRCIASQSEHASAALGTQGPVPQLVHSNSPQRRRDRGNRGPVVSAGLKVPRDRSTTDMQALRREQGSQPFHRPGECDENSTRDDVAARRWRRR
jgi:hypothetical protein